MTEAELAARILGSGCTGQVGQPPLWMLPVNAQSSWQTKSTTVYALRMVDAQKIKYVINTTRICKHHGLISLPPC